MRFQASRLTGTFLFLSLLATLVAAGELPRVHGANEAPAKVDAVVIVKSKRMMTLLCAGKVIKTYKVALGSHPVGPKEREGDGRTPEGEYLIDSRLAKSQFHLALHISYPNSNDRERARKLKANPGGQIMIHGLPKTFAWIGSVHTKIDWTAGCIAVTNAEMEEIWSLVPVGTRVQILP